MSLEGHLIGSIEGFRFTLQRSEGGDAKGVAAAAAQVVAPEIAKRAERVDSAAAAFILQGAIDALVG